MLVNHPIGLLPNSSIASFVGKRLTSTSADHGKDEDDDNFDEYLQGMFP